jgi:hypothetical protein
MAALKIQRSSYKLSSQFIFGSAFERTPAQFSIMAAFAIVKYSSSSLKLMAAKKKASKKKPAKK